MCYSEPSGLRDDYVFGPDIDEPLAKRNAARVVTYLAVNGLGSIVAEVTSAGIAGSKPYPAFGGSWCLLSSRFTYTGREPTNISDVKQRNGRPVGRKSNY